MVPYPAAGTIVSHERSTIKGDERERPGADSSEDPAPLSALFFDHHLDHPMSAPPAQPNANPSANRMSVKALCSPPSQSQSSAPSSTLPPHMARDRDHRLTQSPQSSSTTSALSPPSTSFAALSPGSPTIATLDHSARSFFTNAGGPSGTTALQQSTMPGYQLPFASASVPTGESSMYSESASGVMHPSSDSHHFLPSTSTSTAAATGAGKRKRDSPSAASVSASSPAAGSASSALAHDEFDDRSKTWKHATGFRRDLTADRLTQPDAPTRRKRHTTVLSSNSSAAGQAAAATPSPGALPSPLSSSAPAPSHAETSNKRARRDSSASQHSGSGDSIRDASPSYHMTSSSRADGELGLDLGEYTHNSSRRPPIPQSLAIATQSGPLSPTSLPTPTSAVASTLANPDEVAKLEKKRRQNTQAARRSRIRKAEEVQRLQTELEELRGENSELRTRVRELESEKAQRWGQ